MISLLREAYRLLALAICLNDVLPVVVLDSQNAFVEGCHILEAMLVANKARDSRFRAGRLGFIYL